MLIPLLEAGLGFLPIYLYGEASYKVDKFLIFGLYYWQKSVILWEDRWMLYLIPSESLQ